jgi:hypothetical protein
MRNEWETFCIKETRIQPLAYLVRVDEPEFGCEGRPDGQPVYGTVVLRDAQGERTVPIEETCLMRSRLDDKMTIGLADDRLVLVSRTRTEFAPLTDDERMWWEQQK